MTYSTINSCFWGKLLPQLREMIWETEGEKKVQQVLIAPTSYYFLTWLGSLCKSQRLGADKIISIQFHEQNLKPTKISIVYLTLKQCSKNSKRSYPKSVCVHMLSIFLSREFFPSDFNVLCLSLFWEIQINDNFQFCVSMYSLSISDLSF